MKKYIFTLLLINILWQTAHAQIKYELSAELLGPLLRDRYAMSFEYIPKGNVGLEISLISEKHSIESWYSPRIPNTGGGITFDLFPISLGVHHEYVTGVTVAAKYYMSRKKNGSGLFGGGVLESYNYTGASEAAKQAFRANNSAELPRNLRTAAGFILGYKALIYKHLTLEAKAKGTFLLFSDYAYPYRYPYSGNTLHFNYEGNIINLFISLGYRF
ncbi:MAG: hypothetical protein WCR52_18975 [Bacteroidota bacterium]